MSKIDNLSFVHWGKIPDVTHNGPRSHHHQQVWDHRNFRAVPEGISKLRVILHCHRVDDTTHLKRSLLELHNTGVIDAGSLWENEDGKFVRILNVGSESVEHIGSVF